MPSARRSRRPRGKPLHYKPPDARESIRMERHESRPPTGDDRLDRVFAALGHQRRRRVLARLFERSPRDIEELRPAHRGGNGEHTAFVMYHAHLPKLDDVGYVEWDGSGQVAREPKFEEVAAAIEVFDANGSRLPGD